MYTWPPEAIALPPRTRTFPPVLPATFVAPSTCSSPWLEPLVAAAAKRRNEQALHNIPSSIHEEKRNNDTPVLAIAKADVSAGPNCTVDPLEANTLFVELTTTSVLNVLLAPRNTIPVVDVLPIVTWWIPIRNERTISSQNKTFCAHHR